MALRDATPGGRYTIVVEVDNTGVTAGDYELHLELDNAVPGGTPTGFPPVGFPSAPGIIRFRTIGPGQNQVVPVVFIMPSVPGHYQLFAELHSWDAASDQGAFTPGADVIVFQAAPISDVYVAAATPPPPPPPHLPAETSDATGAVIAIGLAIAAAVGIAIAAG